MKIFEIATENRTYSGAAIEKGGTSIKGRGAAPEIKNMLNKGIFDGKTVLDYGAGKYGRNANAIRAAGEKVYAYDPYHGSGDDGWTGISQAVPNANFDIAFTSYVLNVVPENIEDQILADIESKSNNIFHITRNLDIFQSVKSALYRKDSTVSSFFINHFANDEEKQQFEEGKLDDSVIMEFCIHGTQTSKGFQRIPVLETKGYTLKKNTAGFKLYTRGSF